MYITLYTFYCLYFFEYDLFLLDYNKIHKKQKFCARDIVESQRKEMWSVSYVTCVDIIAQVSLARWSLFLFLDILTLSSIVNEVIRGNSELLFFFFFTRKFHTHKKNKKHETLNNFRLDVFMTIKSIKSTKR